MSLNITAFGDMTKEQIIAEVHYALSVPKLVVFYLILMTVFLAAGLIVTETSNGKKRFMTIWILSVVIGAVFLASFIFLPNMWENLLSFW